MLEGIEFLLKKSRTFKTLSHTLPSLRVKRCNQSTLPHTLSSLLSCAHNNEKQGEVGRSMIEMLGVLAIIAVLSVGGIAGYSKAMEKFKLNKLLEEYSYLISGLLEHESSFTPLSSISESYIIANVVEGMNLVPGSWKKSGSVFYDSTGNQVVPFIRSQHLVFDVHLGTGKSVNNKYITETFSYKMCTNLLRDLLQPLHGIVFRAGVYRDQVGGTYFLGDKYCSGNNCLVNASMTEIQNVCNTCRLNNDLCIFVMEFL